MKHKKFDEVYPYTYYIRHRESGIKYYGVRWGNVSKNIAPCDDLCKEYFTSISSKEFKWFKELLSRNPSDFEYRIHYTFDTVQEAILYEEKVCRRVYLREDWANLCAGKAINNSGKDLSWTEERKQKLSLKKKGHKHSLETRKRISENHADFRGANHPRFGMVTPESTKQKISLSLKKYYQENKAACSGKNNGMYGKQKGIYLAISPSGEEFTIPEGITSFCKEHNIDPSSARRCALGKQKTAKGWKFHLLTG